MALLQNLETNGFRSIAYAEQLYESGPDGEILRCNIRDTDYFWYTIGEHSNFEQQMGDLKSRDFRPIMIAPQSSRERGVRMTNSICAYQKTNWQAAHYTCSEMRQKRGGDKIIQASGNRGDGTRCDLLANLQSTEPTVERKLKIIRETWLRKEPKTL